MLGEAPRSAGIASSPEADEGSLMTWRYYITQVMHITPTAVAFVLP